jgi:hypothetical protein
MTRSTGCTPTPAPARWVEYDGQRYQLKVKPISFSYVAPTDRSRSWSPTHLLIGEPPQKEQKQLRPEFRRSTRERESEA